MDSKYLPITGKEIKPESLTVLKAKLLSNAIVELDLSYVRLIECLQIKDIPNSESVVFDVMVEIGQHIVHNIKDVERICATFTTVDDEYPEVWALRKDFPNNVPHIYLREFERPVSLCLYDAPYHDIKLEWTPIGFIERIRNWLALTSKNELHAPDQPLEPIFSPSQDKIIVPHNLFTKLDPQKPTLFHIRAIKGVEYEYTLIVDKIDANGSQKKRPDGIATMFLCNPQTHGVINRRPSSLYDLHNFCANAGLNLLSQLRKQFKKWFADNELNAFWKNYLILLIAFPKTRKEDGGVEVTDIYAFHIADKIEIVGEEIGVIERGPNGIGLSIPMDETKRGETLDVDLLTPIYSFSKFQAAQLNGYSGKEEYKITTIGVGALGSHIFINLIRSGVGTWTIVDDDVLLPHNLARHALFPNAVGFPKVNALSYIANSFFESDISSVKEFSCDLLNSEKNSEVLEELEKSDVILDTSVSIAVARFLARDVQSSARRISVFLNPTGSDLIILAEPKNRFIKSDFIEMQYYRTILHEPELREHLIPKGNNFRYANSCRDISTVISQDTVAAYSAIASSTIKKILNLDDAFGTVWSSKDELLNIETYPIIISKTNEVSTVGWTIIWDEWFIDKIYKLRRQKLPNETGGVLIGSYDNQRSIIYVVDTIESPPDSVEWPNVYIRGCRGLKNKIEQIHRKTLGHLCYIGEWHSHTTGIGSKPSEEDKKAYKWLSDHMGADNLPPLMLIAGDKKQWKFYLGIMK